MSQVALVNLASLPMPGNEPIFPIGLRCIQDVLDRHGHATRLIDFVESPENLLDLSWVDDDWDVIGFTIRNIDPIDISCDTHVDHYIAFVARVREVLSRAGRAPLLVGGGPGFSLFAQILVEKLDLDVGIVGPGEQRMLQCVDKPELYRGRGLVLHGLRHPGFLADTLDHSSSLMAAYSNESDAMIGVETRRKTCYQTCGYCPYAHIDGDNAGDHKPLEVLADEIRGIYAAGFRRIFFTDGIFNSELRFAKQVVQLLHDLELDGLVWSAYFTPKPFDDEFAALLVGSGVEAVVVSPDSLDPEVMRRLGKSFDTRHVLRFIERSRRHDLPIRVNVVFGGPGESQDSVKRSAMFANEHLQDGELVAHVGFRVLPSTALARDVGLPDYELLYPVYYPFDPDVFGWVVQYLDDRFVTPGLMLNLLAGRSAARRMTKVPLRLGADAGDGSTFIALAHTAGISG